VTAVASTASNERMTAMLLYALHNVSGAERGLPI
jgi:hypothetical protein